MFTEVIFFNLACEIHFQIIHMYLNDVYLLNYD